MRNKIVVLSVMLFSLTTSIAQVQVSKEPRHKKVLENKYIRLLNVWIQPGDTSLFHIHSTPSVFLIFTGATTVSQTKGGNWEKGKNSAGHSWYRSFFQDTLIHRVGNCDTIPFHVTDIELLSSFDIRNKKPSLPFPLLYENEKVFAYRLTENILTTTVISNRGPMIAGLITGDQVLYVDESGRKEREITAGDYLYIEPGKSVHFEFKGKGKLNIVLFEIK